MGSILTSIKKLLGIESSYTHFDDDLIIYINAVLSYLTQLGVGASTGFKITSSTATWDDFLGLGYNFDAVKTYVYLKVKLLFDPPQSSALIESVNKMIAENEWRIFVNSDPVLVIEEEAEDDETTI